MDYYDILQILASSLLVQGYLFSGLDVDGNVYVYIDGLNGLRNKSVHIDLTGRGVSLDDAAFEYIKLLLNENYILRSKKRRGYITHKIRIFIKTFAKIPYGYLEDKGGYDNE